MDRISLKNRAKETIKGNLFKLFLIGLIISAIAFVANLIPVLGSWIYIIFIGSAFEIAHLYIYYDMIEGREIKIEKLFDGFKYFWGAFKVLILPCLFYSLWFMLFIVPGVIKACSYSMAFFIWSENPEMGALEAINKSKEMMNGHKKEYFVLVLSFIGWRLLGLVTFGLSNIYAGPYEYTTFIYYYRSLKDNSGSSENTVVTDAEIVTE